MDFLAPFEGFCPVHFPRGINADDALFFDNMREQIQWDDSLDAGPAPEEPVCHCPEYVDPNVGNHTHASGSTIPGPSDANNTTRTAGQSLSSSAATPGATSDSLNSPERNEASGSASADPAASRTPSPKSNTIFTCDHCGSISAKTPRDFKRHLATKKHLRNASKSGNNEVSHEDMQSLTPNMGFRCPVSTCNGKTFPRKDNLWRHIAKMHGISDREE